MTNTPWRLIDYWWMTHEPNLDDFTTTADETARIDGPASWTRTRV